MSGSSLYPSYLSISLSCYPVPNHLPSYPCKTKQNIKKKKSLLICSLCRSHLSHTNLMSLLQEFKWQRNKYPWNIQVKWAARTKTVWQLHAGQLYRCYPDCCAMTFSSHISFRIKICSQVEARYSKILQINTRSIQLASSTFDHEGYFPLKYEIV